MAQATMFGPPKFKYLANIVTFQNPDAAKGAVKELKMEFRGARYTKRLRIARAVRLAANRAEASSKRKNLSGKEIVEYRQISNIYDEAATWMFEEL